MGMMFKKWKNGIRKTLLGIFVVATLMTAEVAAQAQSLTLEQCIDTALQYNRSYRMSQQVQKPDNLTTFRRSKLTTSELVF